MDFLAAISLDWTDLINMGLLLAFGLFTLKALRFIIQNFQILGKHQTKAQQLINHLLLLFEPIAILLLIGIWVLIEPALHGIIAAVVLMIAQQPIRNYILGRIALFDNAITVGNKLRVNESTGAIVKTERLGVKLRTSNGLKFINYSTLLTDGYSILSGDEVSKTYDLRVAANAEEDHAIFVNKLKDLMATVPYIDWNNAPKFRQTNDASNLLSVKVAVRESAHLAALIALLKEWGYACEVIKK